MKKFVVLPVLLSLLILVLLNCSTEIPEWQPPLGAEISSSSFSSSSSSGLNDGASSSSSRLGLSSSSSSSGVSSGGSSSSSVGGAGVSSSSIVGSGSSSSVGGSGSSSSVGGSGSSSSVGGGNPGNCEYNPAWCGGIPFGNVQINFTSFQTSDYQNPKCLFTEGISGSINPNSGVLINNSPISGLKYNLNDYSKVDGGYYIYIPVGTWTDISGAISSSPECAQMCGGQIYNFSTHFCSGNEVYSKCEGANYNPATQFCSDDNKIYSKCNNEPYNPESDFCYSNVRYSKCNGETYDPPTQMCGNNKVVLTKCGSTEYFDSKFEFCSDGIIFNLCGGKSYNPSTQECSGSSLICKTPLPTGYFCDNRNDIAYKTVTINSQTWMAEDLKSSTTCPENWHMPSQTDWESLISHVGGINALKATTGWQVNGTDLYGFTLLRPSGSSSSVYWCTSVNTTTLWVKDWVGSGLGYEFAPYTASCAIRCIQ